MNDELRFKGDSAAILAFTGANAFLSNFSPSVVPATPLWGGLGLGLGDTAPTIEHAYQAAKCVDATQRAAILAAPTPGAAKKIGRGVALRPGWDADKVGVMRGLLAEKFRRGSTYADLLLSTGTSLLIEGNDWRDDFWGCMVFNGGLVGLNWLGTLLMERRCDLGGTGLPFPDGAQGMWLAMPPPLPKGLRFR